MRRYGPRAICRETFAFAYRNSSVQPVAKVGWFSFTASAPKPQPTAFPESDVAFLRGLSSTLNKLGLIVADRT